VSKELFTQRRKVSKDAKAEQMLRTRLCVFAYFAPLREIYLPVARWRQYIPARFGVKLFDGFLSVVFISNSYQTDKNI
jgi:hypothetical protein